MFDHIYSLVDLLAQHGLGRAVISPGSRNAPLSLAFSRHPAFETITVADERSAAFIALGIAEQLDQAVVMVCTSGSAAYNYAPAVAEAYFRRIPLIVMTADRPPEWIDQLDGQTIRQNAIFGNHVRVSFTLPDDFNHPDKAWHVQRIVNEAALMSDGRIKGPVHINCPFREPFYPERNWNPKHKPVHLTRSLKSNDLIDSEDEDILLNDLSSFKKVMVVVGQKASDSEMDRLLSILTDRHIVIVSDIISNVQVKRAIKHHDLFLGVINEEIKEELKPDLLITFGLSIISKNLKLFLRSKKPLQHWHFDHSEKIVDTFQSLTHLINSRPEALFEKLLKIKWEGDQEYTDRWQKFDAQTDIQLSKTGELDNFNELISTGLILKNLENCHLYLANSMAVRWANFYNELNSDVAVFCNRGTSGIDGCTSTAIGGARVTGKPTVLLTGDVAFFYDRNAFWLNEIPKNLKIILFNNSGGGIFRLIQGPVNQPELEDVFESTHNLKAQHLAAEFKLEYAEVNSISGLKTKLKPFLSSNGQPGIMEVFIDKEDNRKAMAELKALLKEVFVP